jgi:3-isopropylmalate dehydratase large subunit
MNTIVEKIFSAHAGKPVSAGDIVIIDVDATMMQDINGPSVIDYFKIIAGKVKSPKRHIAVLDHCAPCPTVSAANTHKKIRDFAHFHDLTLVEQGQGICHQVMLESGAVLPGGVAIGTDSHACTYGALNAFGAGVGAAEVAVALLCDRSWVRVPETIRINFTGKPAPKVTAKDLSLYMIARLGQSGAIYQSLEFGGDAIRYLSVDARAVICNMSVEAGAKCAIMPCDDILTDWFAKRGITNIKGIAADSDAVYSRVIEIDTSKLVPVVAVPPAIDNLAPADSLHDRVGNEVFIGSCTNGRLEDFAVAEKILRGKTIHPNVRLILGPSSRIIVEEMLRTGIYESLVKSGGTFNMPGCGPCGALHGGLIADGENAVSTANRNHTGRMGSSKGNVYISSPLVAAYSALAGHITAGGDAK